MEVPQARLWHRSLLPAPYPGRQKQPREGGREDSQLQDLLTPCAFSRGLFLNGQRIWSHLRISRSLLHMKLKSLTGCSITQFIRTIKMKEAKTHLLNGMNVSEASFAVGISDPNYFTKCFKKEFNITPTEFLKQLK